MTSPHGNTAGRRWAYFGLAFGAVGSVVANVAHALIPPTACIPGVPHAEQPHCVSQAIADAWAPSWVAIGWGIVVAVALVTITQVLERIEWPDTRTSRLARFGGGGCVALVAGSTSYYHLSDLLLTHGGEWTPLARTGPALVDGVMVVSSFALIVTASAGVALGEYTDPSTASATTDSATGPDAPSPDADGRSLQRPSPPAPALTAGTAPAEWVHSLQPVPSVSTPPDSLLADMTAPVESIQDAPAGSPRRRDLAPIIHAIERDPGPWRKADGSWAQNKIQNGTWDGSRISQRNAQEVVKRLEQRAEGRLANGSGGVVGGQRVGRAEEGGQGSTPLHHDRVGDLSPVEQASTGLSLTASGRA